MRRAIGLESVLALVLALALALVATAPLKAQVADTVTARARADSVRADSVLEARTSALAAQLRCAICQGISIQESPSALAREMRDVVKEQLRDGKTPDEVKEFFVAAYGEWILLSPRPRGLNLLLYTLPGVLLLGGIALIVVLVRRWTAMPPDGPSSP
ncbi:MAG: cytochrome c-type biogenesis protein [Gemmatimonadaceae bacterium]